MNEPQDIENIYWYYKDDKLFNGRLTTEEYKKLKQVYEEDNDAVMFCFNVSKHYDQEVLFREITFCTKEEFEEYLLELNARILHNNDSYLIYDYNEAVLN